jgi:hypothetical protein
MPTRFTVGHHVSKLANKPTTPDDARNGDYTREQLLRMDARFVERMERAFERGLERRPNGEHRVRAVLEFALQGSAMRSRNSASSLISAA